MSSKQTSDGMSSPLTTSPVICVSISITPSRVTFPITNIKPSKLIVHLSNPTPSPITFRSAFTPIDVPLCFSSPTYSHMWSITEKARISLDECQIPIVTSGQQGAFSGKIFSNPDAADLKEADFITVQPGTKGTNLSFEMNIRHGLRPAHKYEFKMKDFDVKSAYWGYGEKGDVVNKLTSQIKLGVGGDEDVLKVRLLPPEYAILMVGPSDEQVTFVNEDERLLKSEEQAERRGHLQWTRQQIGDQIRQSATERERLGLPDPPTSGLYGLSTRGARLKEIRDWKEEWGVH